LHRKELENADDEKEKHRELVAEYRQKFANPYNAARKGYLDDVVEPADTVPYVAAALEILRSKREFRPQKKHGLIPL
jgi:acetyl-CoA carboxylase carboxyltransferase component